MSTHLGFKSLTEGIRAVATGHSEIKLQGDVNQQGGVIVVGPGDAVHYIYRNKETGDHPPLNKILTYVSN